MPQPAYHHYAGDRVESGECDIDCSIQLLPVTIFIISCLTTSAANYHPPSSIPYTYPRSRRWPAHPYTSYHSGTPLPPVFVPNFVLHLSLRFEKQYSPILVFDLF